MYIKQDIFWRSISQIMWSDKP